MAEQERVDDAKRAAKVAAVAVAIAVAVRIEKGRFF